MNVKKWIGANLGVIEIKPKEINSGYSYFSIVFFKISFLYSNLLIVTILSFVSPSGGKFM